MGEKFKELIKELLHDNLEISVDQSDTGHLEVEIYFDGDCICADSISPSARVCT